MQADWPFWIAALALALGVAGAVLAPLIRGAARPERRASYDMQVYRDQLREIDADVARGVLSEDEAAGVRIEISRRLLGAADAEAVEAAVAAPRRAACRAPRRSRCAVALAAGAVGLYSTLGAPGQAGPAAGARGSRDIAAERANRPSQAEVEAIASASAAAVPGADAPPDPRGPPRRWRWSSSLRDVLKTRPDDVEGHRLLARSEASLGNWSAARAAQQRLVDLLGPAAATAGPGRSRRVHDPCRERLRLARGRGRAVAVRWRSRRRTRSRATIPASR